MYEQRLLYWSLAIAFVVCLAAHVGGYLLKSSVTTEPLGRGQGGTPPLPLEVRLDAVAAVLLDGLSYRRAGRMVGISKTEVGDSLDLLLPTLAALLLYRVRDVFRAAGALVCLGRWLQRVPT